MKKTRTLLSIILVMTMSFSTSFAAATVSTKKSELYTVKTEKKQVTAEINEKKKEVYDIKQNIYGLDKKINSSQAKLDQLQSELAGLNVNIKKAKSQIDDIEKDLDKNEELLEERLRVMYKTKDVSYVQILVDSENITDLLSNVNNIKRIVNHDKELLAKLEADKKKQEEQKKSLEASKVKMTQIQAQVKSEQQVMAANMSAQYTEKHKIAQDIDQLKLQEEELQRESSAIEKEILRLMPKTTSKTTNTTKGTAPKNYSGGSMHWPLAVKGTITSTYGSRRDPKTGANSFHQGLDIAAPRGTAVYAASDGVVIFSGYKNSYGNVVMINHGGGIVTVYAHNSSLVAKRGATVKRGQLISKVGSTGYSTGNHLHFEVRQNGSTVNPKNYV
ncbi:MAG: peptidoglycan DD-metalloendopeptidase family protein [Proteocatella sp.]